MSEASRDLENGGDRNQDCNTSNVTRRAPIRFLDARTCDLKITVPRALAERADQGGKHRDNLRYVLALLWRRYTQDGEFRVSMRMLDELHTAYVRRELKAILDDTATPVRNHANFGGNTRCKTYKFNIPRPKKPPTYCGVPDDSSPQTAHLAKQERTKLVRVTIPAQWLWDRYERWSAICEKNDWVSNLDLDGRTDYGRQTIAALKSATVPAVPETRRLTKHGVPMMVVRCHGRSYDPTTNMPKYLRREMHFNGEPTVELDVHAMYSCLLVSKLPNGPAKDRAIAALQGDWYKQFEPAYTLWFDSHLASGRGYFLDDKWMIRRDDDPANDYAASIKVEYQRQCLFWQDRREASSPLRVTLRQLHRELCELIERWRDTLSPRELSHVLTKGEGSMIVDDTMSELERASILAKSNHDGVILQVSRAEEAREILLRVCELHLGFRPRVSIKGSEIDRKVLLFDEAAALSAMNGNDYQQTFHSQGGSHARDF
jgi:hypothetical protein